MNCSGPSIYENCTFWFSIALETRTHPFGIAKNMKLYGQID